MLKYTLMIILLISHFVFAADSQNETSQAFKRMQQLRAQGKLDEALSIGKIYLVFHPSDGDVLLLFGLIYYQQHNYVAAKIYLKKTLIIAPHYQEAQVALDQIARTEQAEVVNPETLVPIDFSELQNPIKEIQILRKHGKLDQAIQLGQTYLKKYPNDADILFLVGSLYFQQHNYVAAKIYLNKTLIIAPHYQEAQVALHQIARIEQAEVVSPETLVPIDFAELQNPIKEIQILRKHGQLDQAIQLGQTYLKKYPNDADILFLVGSLYFQQHNYVAAKIYLNKTLIIAPHYQEAQVALHQIARIKQVEVVSPSALAKPQNPIKEIQILRKHGQLDQAIQLGQAYLKKYPNDADILFLVGSLYFQQKQLDIAEKHLQRALAISPHDLDIKYSLINLYIANKNLNKAHFLLSKLKHIHSNRTKILQKNYAAVLYQENLKRVDSALKNHQFRLAIRLTKNMLVQEPNKIQLHQILGDTFNQLKEYQQAIDEYQWILYRDPQNKSVLFARIDIELILGNEIRALNWVNLVLKKYPNDPDFLALRGRIYQSKHLVAVAANEYKKILKKTPGHAISKNQLEEISKLNPHLLYGLKEVGLSSEMDYISDLKEMWQYTTVSYNIDNDRGLLSLNLNNTTRFGVTASQGLLHVFPVINKNVYLRLTGAYANQPLLFPTYTFGGEAFYSGLPVELSVGYDDYKILTNITYARYTGSISKEIGNYLFIFRPYFYRANRSENSILYTATFFRYLGHKDTYLKLMLGSGTSPDLADLLTTSFLIISNNYVTFSAQFPIFTHRLLFSIGAGYQHWVFHPSNRVRNITGGMIGLNYRFEN